MKVKELIDYIYKNTLNNNIQWYKKDNEENSIETYVTGRYGISDTYTIILSIKENYYNMIIDVPVSPNYNRIFEYKIPSECSEKIKDIFNYFKKKYEEKKENILQNVFYRFEKNF